MSSAAPESQAIPRHVWAVLAVAVLAVSSAAPLVKLSGGVHPLTLGFWRTAGVGLLLVPWLRRPSRRDGMLMVVAGVCLSLHFWSWFASLSHTTVLRSTLLVCLGPLWLGLAEWAILKTPPSRRFWGGIGLALLGIGIMSGGEQGAGSLKGDGLALLGGLLGSAYLFTGREVRQRMGIGPYAGGVSLVAACVLLPLALLLQAPLTGHAPAGWWAILGLTLGPQLLGHNGFNYVVGTLKASVVSAAILLEPLGAAILAALLLAEMPTVLEAAGGAILVVGVGVATLRRQGIKSA